MKKIISLCLVVFMGTIVVGFIKNDSDDSEQPIAYNHYLHVEESGIDCLDCHLYAEKNARASIPNIESCQDCHDEAISESEAESTLLSFITENKKIPWRQIYLVPDHAYFSHRRHVKLAELECIDCHGDVGKMTAPVSEPIEEINMDWCRDCHEENNVSNDCYACHR